ncbi:coil containing protein [Vibrio phage 1.262.O._10N.286.51.A9]|nr:coil containing protein [Vibrio phage 1.262.O._10N.286.51.A9]
MNELETLINTLATLDKEHESYKEKVTEYVLHLEQRNQYLEKELLALVGSLEDMENLLNE